MHGEYLQVVSRSVITFGRRLSGEFGRSEKLLLEYIQGLLIQLSSSLSYLTKCGKRLLMNVILSIAMLIGVLLSCDYFIQIIYFRGKS